MKEIIFKFITLFILALIILTVKILPDIIWYKTYEHIPAPLLVESTEYIRETLLDFTPIGMNKEDVIKIIKDNEEWKVNVNHDYGYSASGYTVGKTSASAMIGEYRITKSFGIGMTAVTVYWGFDEDSKLVDIYVSKCTDAI